MNNLEKKLTDNPDVPAGYLKDRNGHFVPKDRVKQIDKDRDRLVQKLAKNAAKLSNVLGEFKQDAFTDAANFVSQSANKYDAKIGGAKGNITLFSFDGDLKIQVAINENRSFDERLQIAKSLIDECIHDWMKGSNKNIQALIDQAFQVDKQGKVSIERIFGLRKLKIDDSRWEKAMAAIADSIQVTGSKRYIRIYQRQGLEGEYKPISLDVAGV